MKNLINEIAGEIAGLKETILDLIDRKFIVIAKVIEIDNTGEISGSSIYPVVKVEFFIGSGIESTWIRWGNVSAGDEQGDYVPLKVGDEVLVACPYGDYTQAVIISSLRGFHKLPDIFENDSDGYLRGFQWGDIVYLFSKENDKNRMYISLGSGYIHYINDDLKEEYISYPDETYIKYNWNDKIYTLYHKTGTKIIIDSLGNYNITVVKNTIETITGSKTVTAKGITMDATTEDFYAHGINAKIKGDLEVLLETLNGTLSGIRTALSQPICLVTGWELGVSETVKGST